uniref:Transposase zinc-ribbon domain-containing protein n=1 Tax=Candidatus Kentrum sp. LFY TaxID=2126342 RepID=A0A450U6S4_9GAMM|nr:MAG: Transposase zinc-ribbon domain-containing protein [Candidatus Kentron sp. LFY]
MRKDTISVLELFEKFPTEESARIWFEDQRWGGKPTCPPCGSGNTHGMTRDNGEYIRCRNCDKRFIVRIGTVIHRSHIEFHKWLFAIPNASYPKSL